jgi:hypothetical protein
MRRVLTRHARRSPKIRPVSVQHEATPAAGAVKRPPVLARSQAASIARATQRPAFWPTSTEACCSCQIARIRFGPALGEAWSRLNTGVSAKPDSDTPVLRFGRLTRQRRLPLRLDMTPRVSITAYRPALMLHEPRPPPLHRPDDSPPFWRRLAPHSPHNRPALWQNPGRRRIRRAPL